MGGNDSALQKAVGDDPCLLGAAGEPFEREDEAGAQQQSGDEGGKQARAREQARDPLEPRLLPVAESAASSHRFAPYSARAATNIGAMRPAPETLAPASITCQAGAARVPAAATRPRVPSTWRQARSGGVLPRAGTAHRRERGDRRRDRHRGHPTQASRERTRR